LGQPTSIKDPAGDFLQFYNVNDQPQTETPALGPTGGLLTHFWDPVGNRNVLNTWFGRLTGVFDARNQITGLVDPDNKLATWTYDALGRMTQQVNPDATKSTMAYDPTSRLTGVRHTDAGGTLLDEAQLVYDLAGNPLLKVTADGVHTMTYDAQNQLLSENHAIAGVKTWAYDPAGNRLSQDFTQVGVRTLTNWTYDPADQLQTQTAGPTITTFTFDAAGNQILEVAVADRTTYTFDSENRLTLLQLPDGSVQTMVYRGWDGLRAKLTDEVGEKWMIWDNQGYSRYIDLLQERQP
jgi:YD repeat-containing protein